MERAPPRITVALNVFGGIAIISSIVFLGGSFYVESEVGKAFCLGAFFSGLLGCILLFGFAKVIDLLDGSRAGPPAGSDAAPDVIDDEA